MTGLPPLRYLAGADVAAAMPPLPERLALAEQTLLGLAGAAELPPKIGVHPGPDGSFAHAMPAYLPGSATDADRLGMKWVLGFNTNNAIGLPAIHGILLLNDPATGVPTGILDAGAITAQRTAATSGVAIRAWAPPVDGRAPRAALIGAGVQGGSHLPVLGHVLPGVELAIFDTDPDRAARLAATARQTPGIRAAEVAPSARDAVDGVDVVVSAAAFLPPAQRQSMTNAWLAPEALVVPIDYATYCAAEVARDAALFLVDHRDQFLANRDAGQFDGYPDPGSTMGEALASGRPRPPGGAWWRPTSAPAWRTWSSGPRSSRRRPRWASARSSRAEREPSRRMPGRPAMSRDGPRTGQDDLEAWMRWQPTQSRGPLDALLLTPARIVVGIGAALTIVAGLMPWAEGRAPGLRGFEPVFFSGTGGAGDGVVLLLVAAATGFLTLHRTPATSRVRLLRALPIVLVVFAAASWLSGFRAAGEEIDAWVRRGGSGTLSVGLWLAAAGVALMAVGTIALLPDVLRWRTEADDPSETMAITVGGVARVVGGIAGTFIGGAVGISLAVGMTAVPLMGLVALGAVFGGFAGAYAGIWIAGLLTDRGGTAAD